MGRTTRSPSKPNPTYIYEVRVGRREVGQACIWETAMRVAVDTAEKATD